MIYVGGYREAIGGCRFATLVDQLLHFLRDLKYNHRQSHVICLHVY